MICAELEFSTTSPLPRFFVALSSSSPCLFLHRHHQTRLLCSAVVSWDITNQTTLSSLSAAGSASDYSARAYTDSRLSV